MKLRSDKSHRARPTSLTESQISPGSFMRKLVLPVMLGALTLPAPAVAQANVDDAVAALGDLSHQLRDPERQREMKLMMQAMTEVLLGMPIAPLAQAAADMALDYAHERIAGGTQIINHQSVKSRLFHMFRKVEASRAITRRGLDYNNDPETAVPSLCAAMFSKTTGTQNSFEVCSDALQIFGGNGLTKEYPMEKMLRDARASLIEDGCNEVLAIKGGSYLIDDEKLGK